jgi:hypothetical protein
MMQELPVSEWPVLPANSILADTQSIIFNDFTPAHKDDVKFASFYLKRGKKTLFINIGESWTYGERLPSLDGSYSISTGSDIYSFGSQLLYTFGTQMAKTLDCDLYQHAVPGNSNVNMLVDLDNILEYVASMGYEKIYLSLQITESHRDGAYTSRSYFNSTPLSKIYLGKDYFNQPVSYEQWVKLYHKTLLDWYQTTLDKYYNLNIDPIVWSNFCMFDSNKEYLFKHIKPSWIAYSAMLLGVDYQELVILNATAVDPKSSLFIDGSVYLDLDWANDQLSKIDKTLTFIHKNKYHNNHPSIEGHRVWADYLIEQSKWTKNI